MKLLVDFKKRYKKATVNGLANSHVQLVPWDRLVRYVSAKTGQVRYGDPLVDASADIDRLVAEGALKVRVLEGDSWLRAVPTDEIDEVKEILSPLAATDVPIIRCTGLNYLAHSKCSSH
jgi:hypothetical protein